MTKLLSHTLQDQQERVQVINKFFPWLLHNMINNKSKLKHQLPEY